MRPADGVRDFEDVADVPRDGAARPPPVPPNPVADRQPVEPDAQQIWTDIEHGRVFAARNRDRTLYCPERKGWLVWDRRRWAFDASIAIEASAKETAREIANGHRANDELEAKVQTKLVEYVESSHGRKAMLEAARSEPGMAVAVTDLDREPWLFNCANGTLDLRNGTLRKHRATDRLTQLSPVEYKADATCPRFEAFLARVQPDVEVRRFIQRFLGYALTGVIREHVLLIFYGGGRNGKGVLVNVALGVLGDYGTTVPAELLMAKKYDAHPTERMTLLRRRLAAASETEEGRALNVALVKQLTGGDAITGRYMRQDFVQFPPTHKFALSSNHRPVIRETQVAIWDRIHLVPWKVYIPEAERVLDLETKLLDEGPGILRWLVAGCLAWQREGLRPPSAVVEATQAYRREMDDLAAFLDERCVVEATARVGSSTLYACHASWRSRTGRSAISQKVFTQSMVEHDFTTTKSHGLIVIHGVRCATPEELAARRKTADAAGDADDAAGERGEADPPSSRDAHGSARAREDADSGDDSPSSPGADDAGDSEDDVEERL